MQKGDFCNLLIARFVLGAILLCSSVMPPLHASPQEINKIVDMAPKSVSAGVKHDMSNGLDYSDLLVRDADVRTRLKTLSDYVAIHIDLPGDEKDLLKYFYRNDLDAGPGLSPEGMRLSEHFYKIQKEQEFMSKLPSDGAHKLLDDLVTLIQWLRREFLLKLSFKGLNSTYVIENTHSPELKLITIVDPLKIFPQKERSIPSVVWEYGDEAESFVVHMKGVTKQQCEQVTSFALKMSYHIAFDKVLVRPDYDECKDNIELTLIAE